jgi:hypothetical protein
MKRTVATIAVIVAAVAVRGVLAFTLICRAGSVGSGQGVYHSGEAYPTNGTLPAIWILGQSNANGRPEANAPGDLLTGNTNALLRWGDVSVTGSSHPVPFFTNSVQQSMDHWGAELSLATNLFPQRGKLVIIKTAWNGSTLWLDWDPNVPTGMACFVKSVNAITMAAPAARAKGYTLAPRAIVWIQGYSDAGGSNAANIYFAGCTNLLTRLRTDTGWGTNAHVIIARMSLAMTNSLPVGPLTIVRTAQTNAAAVLPNASWVDLDNCPMLTVNTNGNAYIHFSANGYVAMGNLIASNYLANVTP